jgi:hypothetical protein
MPVTKIRGPIAYSQFEETKPVIGEQPVDLDRGFFDNLSDTYATGWLGAVKDTVERAYVDATTGQTGFDGLDNIPMGYEEYASAYSYASSPEEVAIITANIDETNAARQRLSQNSFMENLGYGLIAGIFDPINLIGGPALKGAGFLAGAIKGGASIGGVNAATEIFRNTADPTSTNQETAANIGFGFVVAGMIGGGIGAVTKAGPGVQVRGTSTVSPEARAKADEVGNKFTKAFNRGEGRAVTEIMQFNNRNVRVVDQPSTKVDASGNKVNASFRSAEAFAEYARRAAVRKAADDALGDVVPDGDEAVFDPGMFDEMDAGYLRSLEEDAGSTPIATEEAIPTGRTASEGETPRTGENATSQTEFEDTIFIDSKAILKSFPDKPWTKPRYEGIEPLADDAFKTPEEYVNFVGYHELWHTTNKQKPNETTAQYENRINTLALEEIKADRLPNSPTRGFFSDLALLPTMQGSMTRYAPDDRFVHGLLTSTGGDHATMTIGAMAGRAATPGGSVFQRSMRWNAEYFKAAHAIRQAYSKYVRGYAAEGEFKIGIDNFTAQLPIVGTAGKQSKMLFDEWNSQVGRAVFDHNEFSIDGRMLTPDEMTLVREAAAKVKEVQDLFRDAAKELGIFDRQKQIQREIVWREKANARDEQFLSKAGKKRGDELRARIDARNEELVEYRAAADELIDNEMKFPGDDDYFHRIFNVGVIRERYDDFADRIAMGFAREARRGGADSAALDNIDELTMVGVTDDMLDRARKVADNLIGEGVEENAYGFGGGVRALRSRVLPLSNKELSEFIVLDADVVMSVYTRRMGPTIEMHRMWGSRNMDAQLDELQTHLITNKYSAKMRENIRWEMEAVRDRVLNQFHAKNPLSWDNRVARAVKNLTNVQIMGRGVYSQVVEVAKTVAIEGHAPMFKALHASFRKGLEGVGHGKHSRAAGEGLEMVMARSLNRGIEQDSAMVVTSQTSIERGLARLQTPFFNANLMNPVTVLMKDWSSVMSAHRLISDSKTLSAALDSGKTLATLSKSESKLAAELASWGINPRTAQVIAKMPVDKTNDLLYLPNIDTWKGRAGEVARDAFLGAMSGIIRSNIVTPGPLQRAAIMDGVFRVKKGGIISRTLGDGGDRLELPMLSLPFQLLSFTMSSSAKTTHAMLSGRDRNAYITLTSMLIGGYLATYLASGDNWENMTWEETAMSAIDRSGVLGWGFDPIKRVEALTGYGPRAALGMEEFGKDTISDEIGAVGGPGAGVMSGVAEAFISDDLSDQQAASNIRRGIPLAGLVWWDEFLKDMTRAAAKNSGLEIDLDPPSMFEEEEEEAFDETMIEPGMVTQQ